MEISRKSLLFKFVYFLTEADKTPKESTLCQFLLRFLGMVVATPFIAFLYVFGIALFSMLYICVSLIGLMFSLRAPVMNAWQIIYYDKSAKKNIDLFIPYQRWPAICGKRIWPVWILPIIATTPLFSDIPEMIIRKILDIDAMLLLSCGAFLFVLVMFLVIICVGSIQEYISVTNKSGHICPKIDFTD